MSSQPFRNDTNDHVFAYIRDPKCESHDMIEREFKYDKETVSTKTITSKVGDQETTTTEEIRETKKQKVNLKVYSQSTYEDAEHFFDAFQHLQSEMSEVYSAASSAKTKDASTLFKAMDNMLDGVAYTEWKDVLDPTTAPKRTGQTWEDFKVCVATFICTKVVRKEDAYNRQRQYMLQRMKPIGQPVDRWWLRMQTLNRYLPYLIPNMEILKKWCPNTDFSKWWIDGSLSEQELKTIVTTRVPDSWTEKLREVDVGRKIRDNSTTNDLVDYFETLQQLEQKKTRKIAGARNAGSSGRMNAYQNNRNLYGGRVGPYQGRGGPYNPGRAWPANQGRVGPSPAGRMHTYYNYNRGYSQQGGRGGSTATTQGRSGRFGVQRTGHSPFAGRSPQGSHGGRYQSSGGRYNQSYYQEVEEPAQAHGYEDSARQEQQEYEEAYMGEATDEHAVGSSDDPQGFTEDELIDQWNESLFLEAEEDYGDAGQAEQYDSRDEAYYGDDTDQYL